MVQLLTTPLLSAKLSPPPARAGLVRRPRLLQRVLAGLRRRLLIIVAPPGFGKTTLLVEALSGPQAAAPARFAWLTLDERDNDPTRFWAYLIAALERVAPYAGDHALSMVRSPSPAPLEVIIGALLEELASVGELILVLDDYHAITSEAIHNGVAWFLEHLPANLHLVIAGRSEPPFPALARLRLSDLLVELRGPDLRFTLEETAEFLNHSMALDLAPAEVAALEARTEGWIGALGLAALSLRDHAAPRELIAAFTGSNRYLVDYLADEVFRRQDPLTQQFLLQTSILDQLCSELCYAVLEIENEALGSEKPARHAQCSMLNAQLMLERLEQAGLFLLPLDPLRRWYRYHALFADFLRAQLARRNPELVGLLHQRASAWYEGRGLPVEAVGHLLAAGDLDAATRLIERVARPLLLRSEVQTVLGWLKALPAETLLTRPQLCLVMAWALALAGQFDQIERYLVMAETAVGEGTIADAQGDAEAAVLRRNVLSEVLAVRATVAGMRRELARTIALARESLAQLPEDSLLVRAVVSLMLGTATYLSGDMAGAATAFAQAIETGRAGGLLIITLFALRQLGELQMRMGQLHRAAATFQNAIDLAAEQYPAYASGGLAGRPIPVAGAAYVGMGLLQYEWNNLEAAERLLHDGIKLGRQGGNLEILLMGPIGLARVQQARGAPEAARETIGEALAFARRTGVPRLLDWLAVEQVRLAMAAGEPAAALAWDHDRGLGIDDQLSYLEEFDYLALAQTRIVQGRAAEAQHLLARMRQLADQQGRAGSMIEIQALQALALHAMGESGEARKALRRALDLAAAEGYTRLFVDLGRPMQLLLAAEARAIEREGRGQSPFATYVRSLLASFPAAAPPDTEQAPALPTASAMRNLVEPLSARELEVLRLTGAGLSNQAIADRLIVGLSTVKKHLNNIYGKLGVGSRTQALHRAREIGLIE